jgi:signal transduction histidine kinase
VKAQIIFKVTVPIFLGLILVILSVAFFSGRLVKKSLTEEKFLQVKETVRRKMPQFLEPRYLAQPLAPSSRERFQAFAEEMQGPSIARVTIWNEDRVIVFSDLRSLIGAHSSNHRELDRAFAEKAAFFIVKKRDDNEPVQSDVGEFLDIYIPIRVADGVVGVVQLHAVLAAVFAPVQKLVSTISYILIVSGISILAVVLILSKNLTKGRDRLQALQEINQAITSTLDLRNILGLLLEKIDLFLPYATATTVRLFDEESGLLEPLACRNIDEQEWRAEPWRGGRGIQRLVFESKAPQTIRNVETDPRMRDLEFYCKHKLISYLGVPLIVKDKVLGVLSLYTKEEHKFSDEEVEFLSTLAGQAAIAIHNSQLYEQTKRQAVELDKANKVKDEFLGFVSHELRTPVNAVMGYTGMVKDRILGEINPQQESTLGKVINRSEELLGMINSLMEAARIEAGAAKTHREEFRLCGFLDELKSTYDVLLDKELTLVWDYPSDLSAVTTDREKLRHILQNLVNNAIKYTDRGGVTISARCLDGTKTAPDGAQRAEGRRQVEFKVADTGIGIPRESLSTIFEMFRQMDGSKARRRSGVGLGLHIVKKFTEMLGGKVEVDSEPGKGSIFTVTLPA